MVSQLSFICNAVELLDGGRGVRFNISRGGKSEAAFAIRFDGKVYAYANFCPHLGTELDWQPGEFFDDSGLYLICATHGAVFMPDSGYCTGGPCRGRRLLSLPIIESNDEIFLGEGFTLYVE